MEKLEAIVWSDVLGTGISLRDSWSSSDLKAKQICPETMGIDKLKYAKNALQISIASNVITPYNEEDRCATLIKLEGRVF